MTKQIFKVLFLALLQIYTDRNYCFNLLNCFQVKITRVLVTNEIAKTPCLYFEIISLNVRLLYVKLNVTQSNWHDVESRPHFSASLYVCATFIKMIGIIIILLSLFNQKYSIAFKEQSWWATGVSVRLYI